VYRKIQSRLYRHKVREALLAADITGAVGRVGA